MTKNPILDELHAVRERLLADAGGTLDALVKRLQAEEQESERPRFTEQKTAEDLDGETGQVGGQQAIVTAPTTAP